MTHATGRIGALALLALLLGTGTPTAAENAFWGDGSDDAIVRSAGPGGPGIPVVSGTPAPLGIDVDPVAGHLYWLDSVDQKIRRADLDGGNPVDLVDIGTSGYGLALDLVRGKLYWTERGDFDGIRRADLDGGNPEPVVQTGQFLTDLAIDAVGGHLYLLGSGEVRRFGLDGSGSTQLVDVGTVGLGQIDLDLVNGKMYWSNSGGLPRSIWRADLSGANDELFVESDGSRPTGGAFDPVAGRVYWTDDSSPSGGILQSANLAGGDVQTLLRDLADPRLMALPEAASEGAGAAALAALCLWRRRRAGAYRRIAPAWIRSSVAASSAT